MHSPNAMDHPVGFIDHSGGMELQDTGQTDSFSSQDAYTSPHLEQKLHAIFVGYNINFGQRQCVLIFDHDTYTFVGATIRTATMGLFFHAPM